MEISPASRTAQAPAKALERPASREGTGGGDAARLRQAEREATQRAEQARAEASRAARAAQAVPETAGGSIEFEQEGATRVMKVLDSKEVLIYQVPPKGQLALVRAEETNVRQDLALV